MKKMTTAYWVIVLVFISLLGIGLIIGFHKALFPASVTAPPNHVYEIRFSNGLGTIYYTCETYAITDNTIILYGANGRYLVELKQSEKCIGVFPIK